MAEPGALLRLPRGVGEGRAAARKPGERIVVTGAQQERVYASFLPPIYGFIYARVGNKEDAEDLTSQVFMKSLDYLDPTAAPHQIEAYLYRIARTTIADHWRRYAALRVVPLDEAPEAMDVEASEEQSTPPAVETLAGDLERILGLLPPNYRRVLELRFYQGCSIKETARALNVSEGNAKVLQYRAVHRAAELAREGGTAP